MSRKKSDSTPAQPKLSKYDLERAEQGLPPETKSDKFVRLGMRRVPRARKAIEAVGALANKSSYQWTTKQQADVIEALESAVKAVKNRFTGNQDDGVMFRL